MGLIGAACIRAAVYIKAKNAKKYRHGVEYGSARWGNAQDIAPFINPKFDQNILLTQTERIMVGRNKIPILICPTGPTGMEEKTRETKSWAMCCFRIFSNLR